MPSYLPLHISAFLAINLMLLALSHAAVAKSARFKHFPAPRFLSTARAALTAQREAFDANIPAHKSFRIIKDEFVEEYSLRALMYEHDGTGAQVRSWNSPLLLLGLIVMHNFNRCYQLFVRMKTKYLESLSPLRCRTLQAFHTYWSTVFYVAAGNILRKSHLCTC